MDNQAQDAVFVDAYNLMYRAFHGGPEKLTNKDGMPTGGILTLCKMLKNLPTQFNSLTYTLAVFDGGGNNFRKEIDENYKANRKPMPDAMVPQFPYMKKAFELLGWPCMQAQDVEADDVIATLALRAAKKGLNSFIVSGDKDFRAIVSDNLHVIDTMHSVCYDPATVKEKMGVGPENVTGFLALLGDGTDNVNGVAKVGKGTAAKWLNQFGNVDNLIANMDSLTGVAGQNFRDAVTNGQFARDLSLINMKTDLDIHITVKDVKMKPIDVTAWNEFCEELDLRSLITKYKPAMR